MTSAMRQSTLESLGLGSVLQIFQEGRLPIHKDESIEKIFGPVHHRGSLVISGANGIVGAGKLMQFSSRLEAYGVRVVALDFPNAPSGFEKQYPRLEQSFGNEEANRIASNIVRLTYNGTHLPTPLKDLNPRFLLEAIPEILEVKRSHYRLFSNTFPGIEIRSVTSGFPSSQLGVGIAHPSYPHEINKVFEIVEGEPQTSSQLFWSLGLIPIPVGDYWSFVLDVLFCGLTLAGTRYRRASNMPYWKIDKYIRRMLGPNPFRAHDVIGAKGATFLTWSCLHHLSERYGDLFRPTPDLISQKESGLNWYSPDHFRPIVDWRLDEAEEKELQTWILGPLFQMTSLMLHEKRAWPVFINRIGEFCAQFQKGILAVLRQEGPEEVIRIVEAYHRLEPQAAQSAWYPQAFERMDTPEWNQLYVNAEHNGFFGVITLGRETYNWDVDTELNRAIDWLKTEHIERVVLTGDFHLTSQLVGADISEFYRTLDDAEWGENLCRRWTRTARRLHHEFQISIGFMHGKRCLGGMLELMMHCHYLIAVDGVELGMPEVTVPVIPGMDGCHWPFRKSDPKHWPPLMEFLLGGKPLKAENTVGFLIDYAGSLEAALEITGKILNGYDCGIALRSLQTGALQDISFDPVHIPPPGSRDVETTRKAIAGAIAESCRIPLEEALVVQARHSAGFLTSQECRNGRLGREYQRVMIA